jgi:hypothetical protein
MITRSIFPTNRAAAIPLQVEPCMRRESARLIDHDRQYVPVLVAFPEYRLLQSAHLSLGDMEMDAGDRLQLLLHFIRRTSLANPSGGYIPCSQKIVEQIAYLSYWQDLTLEFHLEVMLNNIVVMARFPKEPGLSCVLDVFPGRTRSYPELQKWFYFLCHIVREHAQIWQIHLIVSKSILGRLRPSQDKPDVFVEVVDEEK